MPETTYNPSITVDTGLYCPICRGAIQANLTDSSVGPIVWDVFCTIEELAPGSPGKREHRAPIFTEFIEIATKGLSFQWAREAWDNYHKERANANHVG